MHTLCTLILLPALAGCAGVPLDGPRAALDRMSALYTAAAAPARAERKAEIDGCLLLAPARTASACLDDLDLRWAERLAALRTLYAVTSAGIAALHIAEAQQALGSPITAATIADLLTVSARAVDAGAAWQHALAAPALPPSPPPAIPVPVLPAVLPSGGSGGAKPEAPPFGPCGSTGLLLAGGAA